MTVCAESGGVLAAQPDLSESSGVGQADERHACSADRDAQTIENQP